MHVGVREGVLEGVLVDVLTSCVKAVSRASTRALAVWGHQPLADAVQWRHAQRRRACRAADDPTALTRSSVAACRSALVGKSLTTPSSRPSSGPLLPARWPVHRERSGNARGVGEARRPRRPRRESACHAKAARASSIRVPRRQVDETMTSVELPAGLTGLGDGAVRGCSSMTSIELPASLTSLGTGAFAGCSSMKSIELR